MSRLAYSVAEAAEEIGVSARSIYKLIAQGELESVRVGRRVIVTKVALARYLSITSDDVEAAS